MRAIILCCLFLVFGMVLKAQNHNHSSIIKGKVIGIQADGTQQPLVGANLVWQNQNVGAVTDVDGNFTLARNEKTTILIVSYISYRSDTLDVAHQDELTIELSSGVELEGANVISRLKSTQIGHFDLIQTETLGEHELGKAACCNLSESFETSPAVDVSFTDAITGTRQITLLGLAGPYSQLTKENMPDIRGLAAINGMGFIPGTWIESIQLIQGAGSVLNGYESIAGQINTELQKPESMDRFFLNLYANSDRSGEINVHVKIPLGKKWVSGLLLHGKYNNARFDGDHDGFMNMPLNKSFVALNRYEWENTHNIHFEFGARYTYLNQLGGQIDFDANQKMDTLHPWGMLNLINKVDAWAKFGKVNAKKSWQSTALQVSGNVYQQDSRYGLNEYRGNEKSVYLNFIHQGRIGNEKHVYKMGASYLYDNYEEKLNLNHYNRIESVPGIFGEYSYKPNKKIGVVAGMRADLHNQYGLFYTPRLHVRYELFPKTIIRLSAGHGQRTPNVIAEHTSILASSRQIFIHSDKSGYGYGLNPETAWNYGINLTQSFELAYRDGQISSSFYRTNFQNQIVFDMEESPREVHFYNLTGESYANSFQFKVDYELFKRFDVRLAYRYYDVRTTYGDELKHAPLLAPHRGFVNLAYGTRSHWKFDFTLSVQGEKRIPDVNEAGQAMLYTIKSNAFALMNAQISKKFQEKFDFYIGAENLGNYRQENPIISAENPYGPYFDASLVWGPLFGIKVYAGMRFFIK